MFRHLFSIAAFAAGAGLISAQSLPTSISSGCQSTLTSILADPTYACLNPSAWLSVVINPPDTSIVGVADTWVKGMCSIAACSNQTLATLTTTLASGCSGELATIFEPSSPTVLQFIQFVQGLYPVVRQVACLKDTKSNQLCVTETLNNVQNWLGTLSKSNAGDIIAEVQSITSVPTNVTCTDCVQEAYNLVVGMASQSDTVGIVAVTMGFALDDQCGDDFVDGSVPPDILEVTSATSSNSTSTSKAVLVTPAPFSLSWLALSTLGIVWSGFVFLA